MISLMAAASSLNFRSLDWGVVVAYLVLTTILGAHLSGRPSTIRDFFLGGRRLPWWAVCGSIIATEISAVTFIGAPAISFAAGGNLTYLQLGFGAILARLAIGFLIVPAYYQREIYSPYDYLGQKLGPRVKTITTLLFFVGAVLGQGARVFVTAFLLSGIAKFDLTTSIWIIGAFSIGWTLIGGITTVIWTDVIQFVLLVFGGVVALIYAVHAVPGGADEVVHLAGAAGKLQLFDLRADLSLEYTLWTGLFAFSILNMAAFGLDQVMAQRMFCCRNAGQARLAIIASCAGQLVAVLMLAVGLALFAYFQYHPLTGADAVLYQKHHNYLLPIFIVRVLPAGIRGLIVAAVFAAAISSLDSALAALSQASIGAFKKPLTRWTRKITSRTRWLKGDIGLSKLLVVFWGVILCLMANACIAISDQYTNVISLALGLTAYTYGALLGIFLLAFLPTQRDDAGLSWAVPMAMLAVFGLSVHVQPVELPGVHLMFNWADWVVWIATASLLVLTVMKSHGSLRRVSILVAGSLAIVLLHHHQVGMDVTGKTKYLSFAWSFPIGTAMTFAVGFGLANRRNNPGRK